MLPTDFDILPPSSSIPLCIQICASSRPRAASVCAASFSWWGKIRSLPPPWISNGAPSVASAIAEHSMCQPGRPSPHGALHHVSSIGLRAFQSAKSSGSSLRADPSSPSPWSIWSTSRCESSPYSGSERTRK